MRQYIVSLLSQQYIVYEASNGKEGLKEAVEQIPDLIVSDVMMPGLWMGLNYVRQLKKR